jgi:hypothetical protein
LPVRDLRVIRIARCSAYTRHTRGAVRGLFATAFEKGLIPGRGLPRGHHGGNSGATEATETGRNLEPVDLPQTRMNPAQPKPDEAVEAVS